MFDRLEQKRRPVKTEMKDPKLQELQEKLEAKKASRLPLSTNQEICYMAESASGQDEANTAFWLATQAGRSGFPALVVLEKVFFLAIQ